MANDFRVFTSFAVEDANLRTLLVGQGRNNRTPFTFVDMSVKKPWDNEWKTNCRTKIRGCDGAIGIVTNNTPKASGQLWELTCAYGEGKPVLLMYGNDDRPSDLPEPLEGRRIVLWAWSTIAAFLDKL
ncbi:MAG: nucleoside 2-deoxyribosyltransferase [Planctomycetes bacterium]|nr:nucleoside 2-deoxyribosyltransferase [Planctomycetota bacterium]